MTRAEESSTILHASCVALGPSGVLILGASGSGKSALALQLMALGAELVADDRTCLRIEDGVVIASCPKAIRGRIEARGVGLLSATCRATVCLRLVVDLDRTEAGRLPPHRTACLLGVDLPLLHGIVHSHFPAAILQYLREGRSD